MKWYKLVISLALALSIAFYGQNISFAEEENTQNLIPVMTSNTAPSGIAKASSVWENQAKFQPWKAFNRKTGTLNADAETWHSAKASNEWIQYDFGKPTNITKYTVTSRNQKERGDLKTWTFEASDDGVNWVILDQHTNEPKWGINEKREFPIENNESYQIYRININSVTLEGGFYAVTIGKIEMMGLSETSPEPEPEPEPSNNNALLVIKMISGLEKEFDLTSSEVDSFIEWYNNRADGRGKETYMFEKDFNKGPFTSRKDYVAFNKIQSFEVMEYSK